MLNTFESLVIDYYTDEGTTIYAANEDRKNTWIDLGFDRTEPSSWLKV